MKVYYVYPDDYDYDERDGAIIVAENKERALEIVEEHHLFYESQGEVHIEEEDLTTEHIALDSFRAG